jgi:phage antirepressor YoqD-like protein
MRTFKDIRESAKGMVGGFSVEIPKQTISGKTIGGGKNGIFVKAKTARQAISMAAKRLGVDFKMLKVGKVIKESVESLDEAYQQFLDKSPSNWGEEKVVAYGTKKGYKVIGVCGHGRIDGIVLFGLDASDKSYVGKEAKVKTGQTVFRYATRNSMAGDIFPLVKIDVKKGLLYNLSQKSSEGEIEHAEFETKSVKLRYLRLAATANLRDITGFDPGFGSMKESVDLEEAMGKLNAKGEIEMTAKNFAKVHKDYKTKMKGVPYAMQIDPKTGGSALYPVKIIKESVEEGKKPVSQMTPAEKKADAKRRKEYNAHQKSKRESLDLEEGKMKDFHDMVKRGMTAAQIAKKIGMKEKDVAEFMKGMNEAKDNSYTVVHAKKGKVVVTAPTSYDAAQKAAKQWKLKSTGGVDAYLMKESVDLDLTRLKLLLGR